MKPRTRRRLAPLGFTLIELLAASALSAVLMVVVLQVIASLARDRVVLARDDAAGPAPWQGHLVENLRWDLLNADEGTAAPNRLRLVGHASLDRETLAPGHRPVTVVYALESLGGRTWLVRRQWPRGGGSDERGWSELVCPDVAGFVVEPVTAPEPSELWTRLRRRRPTGPATLDPSTRSVRLRVDGPSGAVVDRVIVLR